MVIKTRVQKAIQRARQITRKQINCKYPGFLPTDGGEHNFERERLTLDYFNHMFNLKYNSHEKTKKVNAPKKRR